MIENLSSDPMAIRPDHEGHEKDRKNDQGEDPAKIPEMTNWNAKKDP